MLDLLSGLFTPVMNLFLDFLSIQVVFGGLSFPVWAFFAFSILIGIFMRIISVIGGFGHDMG